MRFLLYTASCAAFAAPAFSCAVGDSYEQVISEKGKPTSHIEAGSTQILSYPDATIKLKDDIVVGIRAPAVAKTGTAAPAPRTTPVHASVPVAASEAPPAPGPTGWQTDYNAALEQAKNEHKHVFLFFTGSDWCGWCMKLNREILKTGEFSQYAQEKLVLVELDFPRQKEQSAELRTQNRMLAGRYNIVGYPTVVVLDSGGSAVARLGYQEGGPGPFLARLQALGD